MKDRKRRGDIVFLQARMSLPFLFCILGGRLIGSGFRALDTAPQIVSLVWPALDFDAAADLFQCAEGDTKYKGRLWLWQVEQRSDIALADRGHGTPAAASHRLSGLAFMHARCTTLLLRLWLGRRVRRSYFILHVVHVARESVWCLRASCSWIRHREQYCFLMP